MWPALLTLQHVGSSPSKSHHRTEGESIALTSPKAGGDKRHSSVSVRDGRHPERLFSLGRGDGFVPFLCLLCSQSPPNLTDRTQLSPVRWPLGIKKLKRKVFSLENGVLLEVKVTTFSGF